jgi:predicted aconitase with swiveling domain
MIRPYESDEPGKCFTALHAMGERVVGQALVAHDGFSARYDLNRLLGVFSRPAHKLAGQSYVDKILVLDTAKGGVATAWMLHEMQSRHMAPLAIVFNTVNTILAQGAALGDVTMMAGFDVDITTQVPNGAMVEIDPETRTLRLIDGGVAQAPVSGSTRLQRVHGPR